MLHCANEHVALMIFQSAQQTQVAGFRPMFCSYIAIAWKPYLTLHGLHINTFPTRESMFWLRSAQSSVNGFRCSFHWPQTPLYV